MLPFCVMTLLMLRPVLGLLREWLSFALVIGSILTACSMGCADRDYLVAKSDVLAPIKRPFRPETWGGADAFTPLTQNTSAFQSS